MGLWKEGTGGKNSPPTRHSCLKLTWSALSDGQGDDNWVVGGESTQSPPGAVKKGPHCPWGMRDKRTVRERGHLIVLTLNLRQ